MLSRWGDDPKSQCRKLSWMNGDKVRKQIQNFFRTKGRLLAGLWQWIQRTSPFLLSVCLLEKGQSWESFALTALTAYAPCGLRAEDKTPLAELLSKDKASFQRLVKPFVNGPTGHCDWFRQDDFACLNSSQSWELCPPILVEVSLCRASFITWFHLALLWHLTCFTAEYYYLPLLLFIHIYYISILYFTSVSCQGCFRSVAVLSGEPWSFAWAQHFRCNVQEGRLVLRFVTWISVLCSCYDCSDVIHCDTD